VTDDAKRATRVSKYMSLVLRHDPGAGGVTLDEQGWTRTSKRLAGSARAGARPSY
jgi:putative RNA 2'-phosphotransferase